MLDALGRTTAGTTVERHCKKQLSTRWCDRDVVRQIQQNGDGVSNPVDASLGVRVDLDDSGTQRVERHFAGQSQSTCRPVRDGRVNVGGGCCGRASEPASVRHGNFIITV